MKSLSSHTFSKSMLLHISDKLVADFKKKQQLNTRLFNSYNTFLKIQIIHHRAKIG